MSDIENRLQELEQKVRYLQRQPNEPFIAIKYRTDAGQTITEGGLTIVNYDIKIYDDLGLVTTGASWSFLCIVAGIYHISAFNQFSKVDKWNVDESAIMYLYKSGVNIAILDRFDGGLADGINIYVTLRGSTDVIAYRGDQINIRLSNTSGGDRTLYNNRQFNWITISLIRAL